MIPAEIVPCEEDVLHGDVVLEALAMGVGQSSEPAVAHANREIEPLDVAGRDEGFVRIAEPCFLLGAYYLGRAVASAFLRVGELLDDDAEVHPGRGA